MDNSYIETFGKNIRQISFTLLLLSFVLSSLINLPYILSRIHVLPEMLSDSDPLSLNRVIASNYLFDLFISLLGIYLFLTFIFGPFYIKHRHKLRTLHNHEIERIVSEASKQMNVKLPTILKSESEEVNCYVFGWTENLTYITFTKGLLSSLNLQQIKPIVFHELGHVANRDISFMTWGKLSIRGIAVWSMFYVIANFFIVLFRGWFDLFVYTDFREAIISEFKYLFSESVVILFFIVLVSYLLFLSATKQQELLADGRALLYLNDEDELLNSVKETARIQLLGTATSTKTIVDLAFIGKLTKRIRRVFSGQLDLSERISSIENSLMIYTPETPYDLSMKDALFIGITALYAGIAIGNVLMQILMNYYAIDFGRSNYVLDMVNNAVYLPITTAFIILVLNLYVIRKSTNMLNVIPKFIANIFKTFFLSYIAYGFLTASPYLIFYAINH